MATGTFCFAEFRLDTADRRLERSGQPVELNPRYFDALALLVGERGQLITKDRFLADVWRGIPVTDEALTQCIRTLRRALGDDAAAPRFIATVPKHGYRFVAPVASGAGQSPASVAPAAERRRELAAAVAAATLGGGLAGSGGGLLYGLAGISRPLHSGSGSASLLAVLVCLCALVGLAGGAGVGSGIALAEWRGRAGPLASALGGALGGLAIAALVNLIGRDAFELLFGLSPGAITGPGEGALLGLAVGLSAEWARRPVRSLRRGVAFAAAAGAAAGLAIALAGGRLMAGSLIALAASFPESRLRFERIGELLGEDAFGPLTQALTATAEGALFAAGVVAATAWVRRVGAA